MKAEIVAALAEAVRDMAPLEEVDGEYDLDREDEGVRDSKSDVDWEPVADLERVGLAVYDALADKVKTIVVEGVDGSDIETVAASVTVPIIVREGETDKDALGESDAVIEPLLVELDDRD